jgi:hypothetical protein
MTGNLMALKWNARSSKHDQREYSRRASAITGLFGEIDNTFGMTDTLSHLFLLLFAHGASVSILKSNNDEVHDCLSCGSILRIALDKKSLELCNKPGFATSSANVGSTSTSSSSFADFFTRGRERVATATRNNGSGRGSNSNSATSAKSRSDELDEEMKKLKRENKIIDI